jgi:tRNA threonylcarbamoyladenosine biosynthesis protein TsaE
LIVSAAVAHSFKLISRSPQHTQRWGEQLGRLLASGDVVCLSGELGAGKTTLVGGVSRGWGAVEQVTSPTFVIVNEYHRADGGCLRHLDCYRLNSGADALALGFEDLLAAEGAMVIEWPERIAEALPAEHLRLSLTWLSDTQRALRADALGPRYAALLHHLQPLTSDL